MASNLGNLLLRVLSDPNYSAKGSPLTFTELDSNLKLLADCISELLTIPPGSSVTLPAYDPGTTYNQGDKVTFGNNIWEYINPVSSSGNTPAIPSTYWEIRSIGAFAHVQNTDGQIIGDSSPAPPVINYNSSESRWEFSNDGVENFILGNQVGGEYVNADALNSVTLSSNYDLIFSVARMGGEVFDGDYSHTSGTNIVTFPGVDPEVPIGERLRIIGTIST